jgi:hypothetical protein
MHTECSQATTSEITWLVNPNWVATQQCERYSFSKWDTSGHSGGAVDGWQWTGGQTMWIVGARHLLVGQTGGLGTGNQTGLGRPRQKALEEWPKHCYGTVCRSRWH